MSGRLLDRARGKRAILEKSRAQERRTAKDLGGERTAGSGNQWHSKGDVKAKRFLVECKRTDAASFSLKKSVLRAHKFDALKAGKDALVEVVLGEERWGMVPWETLMELMEEAGVEDGEDFDD